MRVRVTIQFSRRDAERVWFMAAARSRGLRESLCVMEGRMSALPPEAIAMPARGDYRFVHRRRACSGKPTGNELHESSHWAEKLTVRSAIGCAVGGRMAAETGKRTRPLRVAALIHLRGTS